ncbi:spore germination protein GerPE [Ectobacillus panaciterrae]|uniref:spore germination protein GerPE n=1 Tax=Ectobacillus panaciterrae TaxID=363872 RepID=UPI0003FF3D6F|nr:spore germination protein GerPE [Ectobacillus panaciterrae]
MFRRFSVVHDISVISLGLSGVVQLGDTNTIEAKNRSIAVQREVPFFLNSEMPFEAYNIFTDQEITMPKRSKEVRMHTIHACPFIVVDHVTITSVLISGCFQIGSLDYAFCNSRVLQIRQFTSNDTPSSNHSI